MAALRRLLSFPLQQGESLLHPSDELFRRDTTHPGGYSNPVRHVREQFGRLRQQGAERGPDP